MLAHKRVLLGITGGIAAYKSADLVRRLRDEKAEVQVVMTDAATKFITPLTMQALSGKPVRVDLCDALSEAAMGHIALARWGDLVLIAPASANFIARLAQGFADDLLSTLCLTTTATLVLAPAMNQQMWLNSATQANIRVLKQRHLQFLGPDIGYQACGEYGPGRMLEPVDIIEKLHSFFPSCSLSHKKILITAGPTREAIDPVRYLSNRSSGKMGFALAEAAAALGAEVTLVTGPVHLETPNAVKRVNIETAEQMHHAVMSAIETCDVFIAAAAVADYRFAKVFERKIKRSEKHFTLKLEQTLDTLVSVSSLEHRPPVVIGFAAETDNLIENARLKLSKKNLDMIIANPVGKDLGFESDDNQVTLLWASGEKTFPCLPKKQLARELMLFIAEKFCL